MLNHFLTPTNIATALIAINFIAFAAFGLDKAKARRGQYRIAESTLLLFAVLGGTLGAYAGRALFRHKTRKQPFVGRLHSIALLQVLLLGLGCAWWVLTARVHPAQALPKAKPATARHHTKRR